MVMFGHYLRWGHAVPGISDPSHAGAARGDRGSRRRDPDGSFTGATDPILAADAGAVVRWALPPATLLTRVGRPSPWASFVAAFLTPERGTTDRRRTACRYAVVAATLWAASAAAVTVLTFADLAGLSLSEPALWAQLGDYLFSPGHLASCPPGHRRDRGRGHLLARGRQRWRGVRSSRLVGILLGH